jgi:RNA polymerase sigma factor (sigma-70 family)
VDELAAIHAYQAGQTDAFRTLFALHVAHVYQTAYRIVGDAARAEDVTQETFLILAQRLPDLVPGPLHAWLTHVARNLSHNERRRAAPLRLDTLPLQHQETLQADAATTGPGAEVEAAEMRVWLRLALAALTPRQRAAIVLRYYCGCSLEEIAAALGCRPGTVGAALHQALARLRLRLDMGADAPSEPE